MFNKMLDKIKINTVVSAAFFLFGLIYFVIALGLKYWGGAFAPGPGFIPRWTGGAMMAFSAFVFIKSFKENSPTLREVFPKDRKGRISLFVCWGGLIFFLVFVEMLGFVVTGSIVLTALLTRGVKPVKSAIIGVGLTVLLFLLFKFVLQLQIPVNQFGF